MSNEAIKLMATAIGEYIRTLEFMDDFSEDAAAEVAWNALPEITGREFNFAASDGFSNVEWNSQAHDIIHRAVKSLNKNGCKIIKTKSLISEEASNVA